MQIDMQMVYNVILVGVNILMAYLAARWGLRTPTPTPTPTPVPTPPQPPVPPNPLTPVDPSLPNGLPFNGLFLKLLLEFLAGRKVLLNTQDETGKVQTFGLAVVHEEVK